MFNVCKMVAHKDILIPCLVAEKNPVKNWNTCVTLEGLVKYITILVSVKCFKSLADYMDGNTICMSTEVQAWEYDIKMSMHEGLDEEKSSWYSLLPWTIQHLSLIHI